LKFSNQIEKESVGGDEMPDSLQDLESPHLMFVDPCIVVQLIKKNPTRCNNVSKFYYFIFI